MRNAQSVRGGIEWCENDTDLQERRIGECRRLGSQTESCYGTNKSINKKMEKQCVRKRKTGGGCNDIETQIAQESARGRGIFRPLRNQSHCYYYYAAAGSAASAAVTSFPLPARVDPARAARRKNFSSPPAFGQSVKVSLVALLLFYDSCLSEIRLIIFLYRITKMIIFIYFYFLCMYVFV